MEELNSWDDTFIKRLLNNSAYYGTAQVFSYKEGNFRTVEVPFMSTTRQIHAVLTDLEDGAVSFVHASGAIKDVAQVTEKLGYEQCDVILGAKDAVFGETNEAFKTMFYVHRGSVTVYQPFGEVYVSEGYFCKIETLSWSIKALENAVIFKFIAKTSYDSKKYMEKAGVLDGYFRTERT